MSKSCAFLHVLLQTKRLHSIREIRIESGMNPTENYYPCTKEILNSLGEMYAAGGDFTENIDKAGGEGTAVYAQRAIAIYCR